MQSLQGGCGARPTGRMWCKDYKEDLMQGLQGGCGARSGVKVASACSHLRKQQNNRYEARRDVDPKKCRQRESARMEQHKPSQL
eukprot:1142287-Pelagomonas_calceolata.AAC.2